uniref:Uncharacterized protein n=1 Tax=Ditylenchus dipsaci TaxID=166011 RepID=A0A915DXE2_9BILA
MDEELVADRRGSAHNSQQHASSQYTHGQNVTTRSRRHCSVSERSVLSSELEEDDGHSQHHQHSTSTRNNHQQHHQFVVPDCQQHRAGQSRHQQRRRANHSNTHSSSTTAHHRHNPRQSLSPSIRRSPVNRLKEKTADRRRLPIGPNGGGGTTMARAAFFGGGESIELSDGNKSGFSTTRRKTSSNSNRVSKLRLRALETQVQSLRDQLHETTSRLNETQTENEQLRGAFCNDEKHSYLSQETGSQRNNTKNNSDLFQLRKCLTAAEADVIKQQEAMDQLKSQLEHNSNGRTQQQQVDEEDKFSLEISQRLVSLLKVQVGALSKVLHSSNQQSDKLSPLRNHVDNCIRTVAALDENSQQELPKMEGAFDEVVSAYEKLSTLLSMAQYSEGLIRQNEKPEHQTDEAVIPR